MARTFERVETTAALGSASAPLPSLPQPRDRASLDSGQRSQPLRSHQPARLQAP